MCAIAGIIQKERAVPEAEVRLMADRMVQRGPDDGGVFAEEGIALAHRRLSIIDIKTGHQPMTIDDGNIVIVFNGEIYNFQELREELSAQGTAFHTTSDTEVVAAAYRHWGIRECLERIEGMFAFAIYDRERQAVFVARDRYGEKPLYYIHDGQGFRFASELKAFAPNRERFAIDKMALNLFMTLEYIPAPYSIYEGIRKMMPGHYMEIGRDGSFQEHTYYNIEDHVKPSPLTEEEAKQRLRELLTDSVRKRMVADVPMGAFLSGGIDSSIVCCLMSQLSEQPIKTFSIGFNEREYDESKRAELLARHIGAEHKNYTLQYQDVIDMLDDLILYYDEPFGDSSAIPSYYVARLASEDVKVVLTGDCADELFAGYQKYLAEYYVSRYRKLPQWLRNVIEWIVYKCPLNGYTNHLLWKARKVIRNSYDSGFDLYFDMLCRGVNEFERRGLMAADAYREVRPLYKERFEAIHEPTTYLQKQQILDVQSVLEGCMFPKVDRACMHNSLENRAPFIDRRIAELALSLNDSLKLRGKNKKYILKETFKDILPRETIRFPKKGFDVPIDYWLRHELKAELEELTQYDFIQEQGLFHHGFIQQKIEEHLTGVENHKVLLWNLYVFQKWYKNIYCSAQ